MDPQNINSRMFEKLRREIQFWIGSQHPSVISEDPSHLVRVALHCGGEVNR